MVDALDLLADEPGEFEQKFPVVEFPRQIFAKRLDGSERILDLVRDPAGQRREGLVLVRLRDLLAELFILLNDFLLCALEKIAVDKLLDAMSQRNENQPKPEGGTDTDNQRAVSKYSLGKLF